MYSTKLFAEKVMPKLRDLFPECADDEPLLVPPARASARRRARLPRRHAPARRAQPDPGLSRGDHAWN